MKGANLNKLHLSQLKLLGLNIKQSNIEWQREGSPSQLFDYVATQIEKDQQYTLIEHSYAAEEYNYVYDVTVKQLNFEQIILKLQAKY